MLLELQAEDYVIVAEWIMPNDRILMSTIYWPKCYVEPIKNTVKLI